MAEPIHLPTWQQTYLAPILIGLALALAGGLFTAYNDLSNLKTHSRDLEREMRDEIKQIWTRVDKIMEEQHHTGKTVVEVSNSLEHFADEFKRLRVSVENIAEKLHAQ